MPVVVRERRASAAEAARTPAVSRTEGVMSVVAVVVVVAVGVVVMVLTVVTMTVVTMPVDAPRAALRAGELLPLLPPELAGDLLE